MAKSPTAPLLDTSVDSVELKLTVPTGSEYAMVRALKLDVLDARIRQVFFFDTPTLALSNQGVVLRARRIQDDVHDSTAKIRPVVPREIDRKWRKNKDFKIEVDIVAGQTICSGSLKGFPKPADIVKAADGDAPVKKLFTKDQLAYVAQMAPDVEIPWSEVVPLGPVTVFKLKSVPGNFGYKMTTELWRYPDGSILLELSTKCAPADTFQVRMDARAYLESLGVTLTGGEQETKTKKALTYFSRQIQAKAATASPNGAGTKAS